jgi:hypothetical protein
MERVRVRGFKYYLLNRKKLLNLEQCRLQKREKVEESIKFFNIKEVRVRVRVRG